MNTFVKRSLALSQQLSGPGRTLGGIRSMSGVPETFRALYVEKKSKETPAEAAVREVKASDLPEGDVTVAVSYSSINYKDGLAVLGKPGVVRSYPIVPGIDFAGEVIESSSSSYSLGDKVVLTGWGVGERQWGGFSEVARVKSKMLVHLPDGISEQGAMAIGTAGFTAMLCVMGLEECGVKPDPKKEILVTGAGGGVGSVAVAILANLGYNVVASTGREEIGEYLKTIGATSILPRSELSDPPTRPLGTERWAGVVDTVGGNTLANALTQVAYGGAVAACGLAGGFNLPTTVMPFILRGVTLRGIDSVYCPTSKRQECWKRLSTDLPKSLLDSEIQSVIGLEDIPGIAPKILKGQTRGRVVVKVKN